MSGDSVRGDGQAYGVSAAGAVMTGGMLFVSASSRDAARHTITTPSFVPAARRDVSGRDQIARRRNGNALGAVAGVVERKRLERGSATPEERRPEPVRYDDDVPVRRVKRPGGVA